MQNLKVYLLSIYCIISLQGFKSFSCGHLVSQLTPICLLKQANSYIANRIEIANPFLYSPPCLPADGIPWNGRHPQFYSHCDNYCSLNQHNVSKTLVVWDTAENAAARGLHTLPQTVFCPSAPPKRVPRRRPQREETELQIVIAPPSAVALNESAILVTWTPPVPLVPSVVVNYRVWYVYQMFIVPSRYIAPTRFRYIIRDLSPETQYLVFLEVNTNITSANSPPVNVTTTFPAPPQPGPPIPVVISQNSVLLSWASVFNASDYILNVYELNDNDSCYAEIHAGYCIPDDCPSLFQNVLNSSQTEYLVKKLSSSTLYAFSLSAENAGGKNTSCSSALVRTLEASTNPISPTWYILIGLVLLLILLVAIWIVYFQFFRSKGKAKAQEYPFQNVDPLRKSSAEIPAGDFMIQPLVYGPAHSCGNTHRVIPIGELSKIYLEMLSSHAAGFAEEYRSLGVVQNLPCKFGALSVNLPKNRYTNILPFDHSRVKLTPLPGIKGSDYINANFIDGFRTPQAYVAAQAPLIETVKDWWRMIWQLRSPLIIMVANETENGSAKCCRYWPLNKSDTSQFGEILVKMTDVEKFPTYILRCLEISHVDSSQPALKTKHLHFTGWPDHGVPKSTFSLLHFVRHARALYPTSKDVGPMVTHCSAGVGRTGTFICIDKNIQKILAEGTVDVYGCVYEMRQQRKYMVQSEDQYRFIYKALVDFLSNTNTELSLLDLPAYVGKLHSFVDEGKGTLLDREFLLLNKGILDSAAFSVAHSPLHSGKNRYPNYVPYDNNRVVLSTSFDNTDYINASYIQGHFHERAYIVSQDPLPSTVYDLWCMVWENRVRTIVMLTDQKCENDPLPSEYWYGAVSELRTFDRFHRDDIDFYENQVRENNDSVFRVLLISTVIENQTCIRDFKLWKSCEDDAIVVRQYQYFAWSAADCHLQNSTSFLDFIAHVRQWQSIQNSDNPMLVHCDDGIGRSGIFVTIDINLDRLEQTGSVDIYSTVSHMRNQRANMIATESQYSFCYRALLEFSQKYSSLYAEVYEEVLKKKGSLHQSSNSVKSGAEFSEICAGDE